MGDLWCGDVLSVTVPPCPNKYHARDLQRIEILRPDERDPVAQSRKRSRWFSLTMCRSAPSTAAEISATAWVAAVVATGILLVRAVGTAAEVALPAETMASGSVVWVVMVVGAVVAAVMAVEARAWVVRVVGVAVALGL